MTSTTATPDLIQDQPATIEPVRMADGGRMIIRGVMRLFGVALAIAAVGIWLAPSGSVSSEIMLFKLILSICAALAALGMLTASTQPSAPEVEIDTIRREVRLVRRGRGQASVLLQKCPFGDLAQAEHEGPNVRLWDKTGAFLAEISLTDRTALSSLVSGLRDEGKLA